MTALLLILMMCSNTPRIVPYGISLVQKRTLYAQNEPVVIWIRVGNNADRELKKKYLPDVMSHIVVKNKGQTLERDAKYSKIDLLRNIEQLRMNGHKDLAINLVRLFPEMKKGGTFEFAYKSDHFDLVGKAIRVSEKKLPELGAVYRIKTSMGDIDVELYKEEAPNHAKNFSILVSEGFYSDMIFHRVARGFVIQTGDPDGDGSGGSGFTLDVEWSPFVKHKQYALGMARSEERDSADSQFYICLQDNKSLNKDYTVFGHVVAGQDVVDAIGKVGTTGPYGNPANKPFEDIALKSITILKASE